MKGSQKLFSRLGHGLLYLINIMIAASFLALNANIFEAAAAIVFGAAGPGFAREQLLIASRPSFRASCIALILLICINSGLLAFADLAPELWAACSFFTIFLMVFFFKKENFVGSGINYLPRSGRPLGDKKP